MHGLSGHDVGDLLDLLIILCHHSAPQQVKVLSGLQVDSNVVQHHCIPADILLTMVEGKIDDFEEAEQGACGLNQRAVLWGAWKS